jgi:type VII secretion integral membrane protein EccD
MTATRHETYPPPSTADGAAAPAVTETVAAPVPESVSIYVLANSCLVALTVPAAAPLSQLVDPVVERVNTRLASQGAQRLPDRVRYEFAWIDHTQISDKPNATLASCGVRRGYILQLVPAGSAIRYVPRNENVASALAGYLRGAVTPVTPQTAHAVGVSAIIVAALSVTGLLWRSRLGVGSCGVTCGAVLAGVAALAWLAVLLTARRWPEFTRARDGFAATGIVVTAAAIAALPPQIGVPNLFAATVAVAALTGAVIARIKRYWAAATAVICLCVLGAVASFVAMFSPLHGYQVGAAGLVVALALIMRAPAIGLIMARIPRQPFRSVRNRDMFARAEGQPHDTVSPVEDDAADPTMLSTEQVATAADRSRSVLVGVCLAVAVIQVICAWLAVVPHEHHPLLTIVFVCGVALEVIIAARRFNDRVQAVLLVWSSLLALMAIGAKYAWCTPAADVNEIARYAGLAVVPAVVVFAIGTAGWQHLASPNTRKAVEWFGYVLLVVVVLLCGVVLDIFVYFRTQGLW